MPKRRKPRKIIHIDHSSSDSEDSLCRCICGDHTTNAKRPWLQCTACSAWQHNDCMDRTVFTDKLEVDYLCEECNPDEHGELLAAVARGETPWRPRKTARQAMKAGFEKTVLSALERARFFWPAYQPRLVLSGADVDAKATPSAPSDDFIDALHHGLHLLFDELPMHNLRDLALECAGLADSEALMKCLRKKAKPLYSSEDAKELGVLAEIFRWVEKGTYWDGWVAVLATAGEEVGK